MLDAPPPVAACRVCAERGLKDVQRFTIGAITDGMHGQLRFRLGGDGGRLGQLRHGDGAEATAVRCIAVRVEHPGAARSEGAVGGDLDGGHRQPLLGHADDPFLRQPGPQALVRVAHHHPEPHAQQAIACHLLEERHGLEGTARILEAGDAVLDGRLRGERDLPLQIGPAFFGCAGGLPALERRLDEARGCFAEDARGLPAASLQDVAARRRLRGCGHAGQLHRTGIGQHGMAAGMLEHHRVVGRHGAQRVVHGEAFHGRHRRSGPLLLMPAPSLNPCARRCRRRRVRHGGDDLVVTLHVHQVEHQTRLSEAEEMPVAFDEPRHGRLAGQVDHGGVGPRIPGQFLVGAKGDNAVVAHRQGLCRRAVTVHGDDVSVPEEQGGRCDGG